MTVFMKESLDNKEKIITMNDLCNEFFTAEVIDEFGVGENHDHLIVCPRQNGIVFEGNRIMRKNDEFKQRFTSFLKNKGYGPENISTEELISGEIKQGWSMYSSDYGEDIWVNLHGGIDNNGEWLDFMITNTPEMIRNSKAFQDKIA